MQYLSSKLIHGSAAEGDPHRSLKTPIYESASFDFASAEAAEQAFNGGSEAFAYSRISNPTLAALQRQLKVLSQADHALCLASGMAALSNVFLTLCSAGDNIITSRYLFGNTWSFFAKTLQSYGIEARFTDLEDFNAVAEAMDENTRALFLEVPTNPQLIYFDVPALSALAGERNIPLVVDNTVLTPYLFPCKQYGVDIEVYSNTKFISGGATSVGGSILVYPSHKWAHNPKLEKDYQLFGKDAFFKRLYKEHYRNLGACLAPHNAWLQLLGLETLTLRVDRIMDNTLTVAEHLQNHPKVKAVRYPGLKEDPYHPLALQLSGGKSGCLVGVELENKAASYRFMNALQMVRRGTNFCDNKSMILHPGATIYWDYSEEEKKAMHISEGLLRLSVGLEAVKDILSDLDRALEQV